MPNYTALVTLLAVLLYFYTGILVAKARANFGVVAPATTGHVDFERVFRVQTNTLEWMPIFLPLLWLCTSAAIPKRPTSATAASASRPSLRRRCCWARSPASSGA